MGEGNRNYTIRDLPDDERPREKLLRLGEHRLSDAELLAIILRTGVRGMSALDLARAILGRFSSFGNMSHTDPADWRGIPGLGPTKVCQIKAAIEIGRRMAEEPARERVVVDSSRKAADLVMARMRHLRIEVFKVLMLDSRNRVIALEEFEQGTVNRAHPVPREIFTRALQKFAVSLICIHNHPAGDPTPSREDRDFTRMVIHAGAPLDIKVLDHIIIGDGTYYSFADHGLI